MIFVSIALGFIGAAFFVSRVTKKYGHSKALMLAEFLRFAGFVTLVCRPPFPVTVIAYVFFSHHNNNFQTSSLCATPSKLRRFLAYIV